MCLLAISIAAFGLISQPLPGFAGKASRAPAAKPPIIGPIAIGQGRADLPGAVNEMRDAIISAARTGSVDELLIPIQWNEIPPDFGDLSAKATLADWKKKSPDGTGREWLALLIKPARGAVCGSASGPGC